MDAIKISLHTDFPQVVAQMSAMRTDIAAKATARALNATIRQGQADMARQISQTFRLKQAEVRSRLDIRLARRGRGAFTLSVELAATRRGKGRSMNVIAFLTGGGRLLKSGDRQQLKFQFKREGGRKQITGAFIGNKGRTIFIRAEKGQKTRLPIKAVNTIDVQQMFNTRTINETVRRVMLERFEGNWQREVRNVSAGWVK